jgi:hypothetical protein
MQTDFHCLNSIRKYVQSFKSKAYLQELYENFIFIAIYSTGGVIFVTFPQIVLVSDCVYPLIVMDKMNREDYGNCCNLVHPVHELSPGT